MALGNWTNTPSPENDPNAPPSVGNEGSVKLSFDGETVEYAINSAKLTKCGDGNHLTIIGEPQNDKASFQLTFQLPESTEALEGQYELTDQPQFFLGSSGKRVDVSSGSFDVVAATGNGPWELDGSLKLETSITTAEGEVRVQVSAS